jgi:hypothetical protein
MEGLWLVVLVIFVMALSVQSLLKTEMAESRYHPKPQIYLHL